MKVAFLFVAAVLAGCASASKHESPLLFEPVELAPRDTAYVISHYMAYIVLTQEDPTCRQFGFALKGIDPDGSVTITVLDTGSEASAKIGDYFEDFGTRGLELSGVDVSARSATFVRRWAEHREEKIQKQPNKRLEINAGMPPPSVGKSTAVEHRLPGVSQP